MSGIVDFFNLKDKDDKDHSKISFEEMMATPEKFFDLKDDKKTSFKEMIMELSLEDFATIVEKTSIHRLENSFKNGFNIMAICCIYGLVEFLKILIAKDVSINIVYSDDPLDYTRSAYTILIGRLIQKYNTEQKKFDPNYIACLEFLLNSKIPFFCEKYANDLPLFFASRADIKDEISLDMMRFFKEKQLLPNDNPKICSTILSFTINATRTINANNINVNNIKTIEFLIEHCNFDQNQEHLRCLVFYKYPIEIAICKGYVDIVKYLTYNKFSAFTLWDQISFSSLYNDSLYHFNDIFTCGELMRSIRSNKQKIAKILVMHDVFPKDNKNSDNNFYLYGIIKSQQKNIGKLINAVNVLSERVEALEYAPGGEFAIKAKTSFETLRDHGLSSKDSSSSPRSLKRKLDETDIDTDC